MLSRFVSLAGTANLRGYGTVIEPGQLIADFRAVDWVAVRD